MNSIEPHPPRLHAESFPAQALDVCVVYTATHATMRAVQKAAQLSKDLHARLRLIVPQVVSYSLPLHSPPVLVSFQEARFRRLAAHLSVDIEVEIFLCRDAAALLAQCLPPATLVVLGKSNRWWWLSRDWWLARRLRRMGHHLAIAEME